MTRQLIMVPQTHRRKVGSLPLYQPTCVPPDVNMIELLHIFQAGSTGNKGGHMALVCEKPAIATAALEGHHAVPHEAGVIGIITLEDVFEEMIQAPVYDEGDRAEREGMERAEWAFNRWKVFVRLRRRQRQMVAQQERGHDTEDTPLLAQSPASLYDSPEGLRR
jgi:metal transporter CNNM